MECTLAIAFMSVCTRSSTRLVKVTDGMGCGDRQCEFAGARPLQSWLGIAEVLLKITKLHPQDWIGESTIAE